MKADEEIKKDPIARRRVITRCDEIQRDNISRVLDVILLPEEKQSDTPASSSPAQASSPLSPRPPSSWGLDFTSKEKKKQQQEHSDSEDSYDTCKAKQSEVLEKKQSHESCVTEPEKKKHQDEKNQVVPKEKEHQDEKKQVVPALCEPHAHLVSFACVMLYLSN